MSILRRTCGDEPRRTRYVRSLQDQHHGAVLWVSPEGLIQVDGWFLDEAVVGVCRASAAVPSARMRRCRVPGRAEVESHYVGRGHIDEGVTLKVRHTVIAGEDRLRRHLPLDAAQSGARFDGRQSG